MLLCHDIAIQALHYYLALISCMYHAVLALIESDIFAYLGIAILILWKQCTEAAPTTQITPSKLGWQYIYFLRFLHHGIVYAYLLTSREEFADYLLLLSCIEGRSHLVHDVSKVGLESVNSLADGLDIPYEDTCIPIVIASDKVLLGCLQVRFFLESLHLVDFIYRSWLGSCDINQSQDGLA